MDKYKITDITGETKTDWKVKVEFVGGTGTKYNATMSKLGPKPEVGKELVIGFLDFSEKENEKLCKIEFGC